jgi:hypothetical protein
MPGAARPATLLKAPNLCATNLLSSRHWYAVIKCTVEAMLLAAAVAGPQSASSTCAAAGSPVISLSQANYAISTGSKQGTLLQYRPDSRPAALLARRSAFEDHPDIDQRRHLLRLWLSPAHDRPLPPVYSDILGGSVEVGDRGGIRIQGFAESIALEAE